MENRDRIVKQTNQVTLAKQAARRLFAAWFMSGLLVSTSFGQQGGAKQGSQSPRPGTQTPRPGTQTPKSGAQAPKPNSQKGATSLSEKEKKQEKARELFADAVNTQNNGEFPRAIELWNRLIKEYPTDPLVASARHFLGICYLQKEKPN